MQITNMGQVRLSVQELLALRLEHLHSEAEPVPSQGHHALRQCGTTTTLRGYTEWQGVTKLPISIGWDWCIHTPTTLGLESPKGQPHCWQRDDWPRTNIQLLDEHGQPLPWQLNLSVLATWVDAQAWQTEVAQALGAAPQKGR
jgi:hypothetical protein